MKKFVLFLMVGLASVFAWSQSPDFSFAENVGGTWKKVANGGTITFSMKANDFHEFYIPVRNEASTPKMFYMKKFYIQKSVSAFNETFCWDQCYTQQSKMQSDKPVDFQPQYTDSLHCHLIYDPMGHAGETVMRYTFWDKATPNDTGYVIVHFISSLSGTDEQVFAENLTAFPNPCANKVTFRFSAPLNQGVTIRIFDLLGVGLKQFACPAGNRSVTADLSELQDGIYMYQMEINGIPGATRKLIVRK